MQQADVCGIEWKLKSSFCRELAARDCGIGGGPADQGQLQGGVRSGDKLCLTPETQLSSLVHYSHTLEMYLRGSGTLTSLLQGLHQFVAKRLKAQISFDKLSTEISRLEIIWTLIHLTFYPFKTAGKKTEIFLYIAGGFSKVSPKTFSLIFCLFILNFTVLGIFLSFQLDFQSQL